MKIIPFIASNSQYSRRKAEELVKSGKVKINKNTAKYTDIVLDSDEVYVNNKKINHTETKTFLVYKPVGYISTTEDPENRKTVLDLIPKQKVRLYPVGRLDKDSKGLMILTNDGELANKYMHPRYEMQKKYLVKLESKIKGSDAKKLEAGIKLKDGIAKADKVTILDDEKNFIEITLHEGKNREIRRMLGMLGYTVTSLERIAIGEYKLSDLGENKWMEIKNI